MSYKLDDFRHQMLRAGDVKDPCLSSVAMGRRSFSSTAFSADLVGMATRIMPVLAERHTVVALDFARSGSFPTAPRAGYDKASLAEDVHGVMGALGFERYGRLRGMTSGAMVALALAFTQP